MNTNRYRNTREALEMQEDDLDEQDVQLNQESNEEADEKPKGDNWQKRYGDLRRYQQEQELALKNQLTEYQRQIEGFKTGTLRPPKTQAEIQEWVEKYPDFADILDVLVEKKIDSKTQDLRAQSQKLKKKEAFLQLQAIHPDAAEIIGSEEFQAWLLTQSKAEYNIIHNSFDVENAAFVLDKYKIKTKRTKQDRDDFEDDFRQNGKTVKTRQTKTFSDDENEYWFSESQIESESNKNPRWWDANEAKIEEAERKGKILYDLSGGAR